MESPSRIGNYAIEKTLGQGGVGKVYLARDEVLGRRVVVKVLHNIMDSEAKRRFLEEARAQSTLNHPNIVQIYGWGEEESTPYLVMEWVEGEDLHQALEHGRIADLRQKLMVAFQIAKALEHIHAHGIVHRDIKPENIFRPVRTGEASGLRNFQAGQLGTDASRLHLRYAVIYGARAAARYGRRRANGHLFIRYSLI